MFTSYLPGAWWGCIFLTRTNFWQISTSKYDFNLSERHYSAKNSPNLPDFEENFPNFQIFMISIQ
jgi:hypothetical protein